MSQIQVLGQDTATKGIFVPSNIIKTILKDLVVKDACLIKQDSLKKEIVLKDSIIYHKDSVINTKSKDSILQQGIIFYKEAIIKASENNTLQYKKALKIQKFKTTSSQIILLSAIIYLIFRH